MITVQQLEATTLPDVKVGKGYDQRAVSTVLDLVRSALTTGRGPVVTPPLDPVKGVPRLKRRPVDQLMNTLRAQRLLVVDPECRTGAYLRPDRLPGGGAAGAGPAAPAGTAEPDALVGPGSRFAPPAWGDAQQSQTPSVAPEWIMGLRFRPSKFRTGYNQDEVDDFLDEVVAALREGRAVASPRFSVVKFAEGYDMQDVDVALDRIQAAGVIR